jgi:hypothetical protein
MSEDTRQLKQKIEVNKEIIANLKEFFGTYLSNFLKEYRNRKDAPDERLDRILKRQDEIYQKFQELMKGKMSEKQNNHELLDEIQYQEKIIATIREFFTSNSKFIKLYRKNLPESHPEMESLLDQQEKIFERLQTTMNP